MPNITPHRAEFRTGLSAEEEKLILHFFVLFARFESALKQVPEFRKVNGNNKKLEPKWTEFAKSIEDKADYSINLKLSYAMRTILQNPPKIQCCEHGRVIWKENRIDSGSDTNKASTHIRTIRNNLFHGAKFEEGFSEANTRNTRLIEMCITILEYWLTLDARVSHQYNRFR
ncbi:MAG: hypothetical protein WEC59_05650 [Salibacteraceae bacterium]